MSRDPIEKTVEQKWREVARIEEAYARGDIDRHEWHRKMRDLVVPAYLAGDNPRVQCGFEGDEAAWRDARILVADSISSSGTFLDVGCANGLLMESVVAWCRSHLAKAQNAEARSVAESHGIRRRPGDAVSVGGV